MEKLMPNVVYSPTDEEIALLKNSENCYWEVWRGLPDLEFLSDRARSGAPALKYERDGHYIWVPPEACEAYNKNREQLFFALIDADRSGHGVRRHRKIKASWLIPEPGSLDDAIRNAMKLNSDNLIPYRR